MFTPRSIIGVPLTLGDSPAVAMQDMPKLAAYGDESSGPAPEAKEESMGKSLFAEAINRPF
jgi:CTP:molybdopterin cytidylyltransferase MocA